MNKERINNWTENLGKAWTELNSEKAMALFDKEELAYYESALKDPTTSWTEVKKLWDVVPKNQKDVTFSHEILCCNEEVGIIHWKVTRTFLPSNENQNIDGIFEIKLNDNNLCTYFKQWRTTEAR